MIVTPPSVGDLGRPFVKISKMDFTSLRPKIGCGHSLFFFLHQLSYLPDVISTANKRWKVLGPIHEDFFAE